MSSKQVCNTSVEDCPLNWPSRNLRSGWSRGSKLPMKKRKLEVLSNNIQNAVLSTEDDNRRATKSAWRTSDLFIVAQDLCTAVCSCTVWHQCESCTPHLNTTSTSAFSVLPSYSALTFLCLFASLFFTYLGARRGANVLVVTSSWSCTSSCPWCQLMGLLLLMEPWSALIHYWSNTARRGQESFKTAFQDACRCRKFKSSLFLSVYSQMFSLLA